MRRPPARAPAPQPQPNAPPPTRRHPPPSLSGGLESLFGGDKTRILDVPAAAGATTAGAVVAAAAAAADPARADLFVAAGRVRPGVLVLVNDTDWELLYGRGERGWELGGEGRASRRPPHSPHSGTVDAPVAAGDRVVFISTLHGG